MAVIAGPPNHPIVQLGNERFGRTHPPNPPLRLANAQ